MKYCGVATPLKGVRVYVRSAMGMRGSEAALEEVMCRVLGPLPQNGSVAKSLMICTAAATHPESYSTNHFPTNPTQGQPAFVCPQGHHQAQDYHYSRLDLECWLPFRQSPPS